MGTNTSSDTARGAARPADPLTVVVAPGDGSLEQRILDATLRCVGRWGVGKTTLDDIAREAGCSRATIYRVVPGGKDRLMLAAAEREIWSFLADLAARLEQAETMADLLTVALCEGVTAIRGHEILQYLLAHEPEVVLPHVSFDGIDPLLDLAAGFITPYLQPHLGDTRRCRDVAEWLTRVVISYAFDPDDGLPLTDPVVARRFVETYFLPGVLPGVDARRPGALDLTAVNPQLSSTAALHGLGEPNKEHVQS